jgi:hypothetical protein
MAQVAESRTYAGKSPDDCFAAAKSALSKTGFEIWKTRQIGWLVMANRKGRRGTVSANCTSRPGAAVTLTLSGEEIQEADLRAIAEEVLAVLTAELG